MSLSNNLVNYASIITIALNSVSSRFVALAVHQGKKKEANEFFNSVFWADMIICVFILLAGIIFTVFIDDILNVPTELVSQVQQLFVWTLLNFILSVIGTVFTMATYITNKLYLSSIINSVAILMKAVLLLLLFRMLPVSIIFIGIASFMNSLNILIANAGLTRKLTPELTVSLLNFSRPKVREMFNSGIWSSLSKLSATLSDGLDTLITNLFLNGAALGALTVAYTVPSLASQLVSSLCSLFNPNLTYCYAKEDIEGIIKELKRNMKLTGIFSSILFCGIITCGQEFFTLLVPDENITLIFELACLSCISIVVSGVTAGLSNVFVLTNKLKINSIVWLTVSAFDIVLVLILVKTTGLGVYAIAGVSKVIGAIINLTYLPIYASKCLKIKSTTFYPLIVRYFAVLCLCLAVFVVIRQLIGEGYSWVHFVLCIFLCGAAGLVLNYILFLDKDERNALIRL